jgi:type II secretory pathway component GspD/PulD (secretin)
MTVLSIFRHILVLALSCIAIIISPAYAEAESGATRVEYVASTDSLSVDVQDAEINSLLMHIASQTGIRVLVDPDVTGVVTTSFSQQPMREALAMLLGDFNVITLYEQQDVHDGQLRVSELRILPTGVEDNSMLRSIEDLQQDLRQQNAMIFRTKEERKQERRRTKLLAKLGRLLERIESLKESDPKRYMKKIARLHKRYPEIVELLDKKKM